MGVFPSPGWRLQKSGTFKEMDISGGLERIVYLDVQWASLDPIEEGGSGKIDG